MVRKMLFLAALLVSPGYLFQATTCQPALQTFVRYAAAGYFDPFFANGPWLDYTEPWY